MQTAFSQSKRPTKPETHLFHENTPKSQSETRICKESAFALDGSGKIKKPRLPLAGSSLDHSDKPRILTTHEEAGRRKSTPMTRRQMQPWPTCPIQRPLNICGSFQNFNQAKKIPAILLLQRLVLSKAQNRTEKQLAASKLFFRCFFLYWSRTYFARGVTNSLSYKYQTL